MFLLGIGLGGIPDKSKGDPEGMTASSGGFRYNTKAECSNFLMTNKFLYPQEHHNIFERSMTPACSVL
jgi:hypothetical protein